MNIVALGYWLSIPFVGNFLIRLVNLNLKDRNKYYEFFISLIIGISIWSIILLIAMLLGMFNTSILGIVGWLVFGIGLYYLRKSITMTNVQKLILLAKKVDKLDIMFLIGFIFLSFLYLGFPHESIFGGRDQGIYSNSAVYIANTGGLNINFPAFENSDYNQFMPGFYKEGNGITAQFSHLFSVWLAQAYGTFGIYGLFAINSLFGLLSVITLRVLLSQIVGKVYAIVGSLLLGFNVSQLWISRITLTEIFTQLLLLSFFCLLLFSLKEKEPKWAGLAGLLLGLTVICRIDSILLLPLLVFCYLLSITFRNGNGKVWGYFFALFGPLSALATIYYYFYSRPYFLDLWMKLFPMFVLALIFALLIPVALKIRLPEKLLTFLFYMISLVIVFLFIYAHFIRPHIEPFSVYHWPGHALDQTRNYQEESIGIAAKYLSIPILYLGLIGWILGLKNALVKKNEIYLILVVIVGGFSMLYFYNPNISPDQYWAIRRFVPVIFPGIILFSMIAAKEIVSTFVKAGKKTLLAIITLIIFLVVGASYSYNLLPVAFYKEQEGVWKNTEEVSKFIPNNSIVLSEIGSSYETPLFMSFGKKIIPINSLTDEGKTKFLQIINTGMEEGVFLLSTQEIPSLVGVKAETVHSFELKTSYSQRIPLNLPRAKQEQIDNFYLYRLFPSDELSIGVSPSFGVTEDGFYSTEQTVDGQYFRWTTGNAQIMIPKSIFSKDIQVMDVNLVHTGPDGRKLSVQINDEVVYEGVTNNENKLLSIKLNNIDTTEDINISIVTETWSPAEHGSGDTRELGIAIGSITAH